MNNLTFDVEIQQKVLALMVQDRIFMSKVYSLMKPFYFDSEVLVDMARIALDYFANYGTTPTPLSLGIETAEFLKANHRKSPAAYMDMIDALFTDNLNEKEFIDKIAIRFIQFQEVRNAYAQSMELLEKYDFAKMKQIMDKAFSVSDHQSTPLKFFDHESILERYEETEGSIGIPTGFEGLDRAIGGGLCGGELGIILAPPNVGKSIVLSIIGANGLRIRKKILHISLEMSKVKTAIRYDRNLLNSTRALIKSGLPEMADKLMKLNQRLQCDLYIDKFPTRGLSVPELRSYINRLKCNDNFVPDELIVDYGQIMKPSRARSGRHEEIEEINEELRGLGGELNVPVWSAAQTKQSSVSKAVVTIEDLGESFGQAKVADVIVALCQTKQESDDEEMRFFLAKNRDDKKFLTFRYKTAFDVMRLISAT